MTLGVREAEMLNARWEWLTADTYSVRSRTKGKKHRDIATYRATAKTDPLATELLTP